MASGAVPQTMTLDTDDLNNTDEGILSMLREGRCTPRYIAGELDLQQPYVNQRLKRLVEHGHVERIDRGLYELLADPRDEHDEVGERDPERPTQTPGLASEEPPSNTPEPAPEAEIDLLDEYREWLEDRSPQKAVAKDLVVDVLRLLRDRGPMETNELQSELFPEYEEHYSEKRTMWNSVSRYFSDLPGFEKPDYGQWGYAGDEEVREAIYD